MRRSTCRLGAILAAVLLVGASAATVLADEPVPSAVFGSWFDAGQPLEAHHVITLAAGIQTTSDGWATDATVKFEEVDGRAPQCQTAVDPSNQTLCQIPSIAAGTYHYKVTYSGNTIVAGSVSDPFDLTIAADAVHATNIGRNYSTFYPRKDGYRDSLSIYGSRQEPIAVSIKIYNSSNSLVKSVTKARATGAYSYAWSGRNSAGTILPSGKYRIVQKLTDAAGTTRSVTLYANLSKKVLVTKTTYVTKNGSSVGASGGSVRISTTSHYAKLHGSLSSAAVVGYQFTLPSATVYKSIRFQVYAKAPYSVPPNLIAMQNFNACPLVGGTWDLGCFDHWGTLGYSTTALHWSSTTGSPSHNRIGRIVRGAAVVQSGTIYIYKARVRVVYQVLQ
jgi:hypothetical protein